MLFKTFNSDLEILLKDKMKVEIMISWPELLRLVRFDLFMHLEIILIKYFLIINSNNLYRDCLSKIIIISNLSIYKS